MFENIIWHINIRPTVEVIVTGGHAGSTCKGLGLA